MLGSEADDRTEGAAGGAAPCDTATEGWREAAEERGTPSRGSMSEGRYEARKKSITTLAHSRPHRRTGEADDHTLDTRDDSFKPDDDDTPRRDEGGNISHTTSTK